jgi:hypothetical protein
MRWSRGRSLTPPLPPNPSPSGHHFGRCQHTYRGRRPLRFRRLPLQGQHVLPPLASHRLLFLNRLQLLPPPPPPRPPRPPCDSLPSALTPLMEGKTRSHPQPPPSRTWITIWQRLPPMCASALPPLRDRTRRCFNRLTCARSLKVPPRSAALPFSPRCSQANQQQPRLTALTGIAEISGRSRIVCERTCPVAFDAPTSPYANVRARCRWHCSLPPNTNTRFRFLWFLLSPQRLR